MSFVKSKLPNILKTSLITSLIVYIPLSLVFSLTNVEGEKKQTITPKQEIARTVVKTVK